MRVEVITRWADGSEPTYVEEELPQSAQMALNARTCRRSVFSNDEIITMAARFALAGANSPTTAEPKRHQADPPKEIAGCIVPLNAPCYRRQMLTTDRRQFAPVITIKSREEAAS